FLVRLLHHENLSVPQELTGGSVQTQFRMNGINPAAENLAVHGSFLDGVWVFCSDQILAWPSFVNFSGQRVSVQTLHPLSNQCATARMFAENAAPSQNFPVFSSIRVDRRQNSSNGVGRKPDRIIFAVAYLTRNSPWNAGRMVRP